MKVKPLSDREICPNKFYILIKKGKNIKVHLGPFDTIEEALTEQYSTDYPLTNIHFIAKGVDIIHNLTRN